MTHGDVGVFIERYGESMYIGKVSIELHLPMSSIQNLKLMGKGGQFTYTPIFIMFHEIN